MTSEVGNAVLLDTSALQSMKPGDNYSNIIASLERMEKPGRVFIYSNTLFEELDGLLPGQPLLPGKKGEAVRAWLEARLGDGRAERINVPIDASDVTKYNPLEKPDQRLDIEYKKYLDTTNNRERTYSIFTNDTELSQFGRDLPHVKSVGVVRSFIAHEWLLSEDALEAARDGDLSGYEKYKTFMYGENGWATSMSDQDRIGARIFSVETLEKIKFHDLTELTISRKIRGDSVDVRAIDALSEGLIVPGDGEAGVTAPGTKVSATRYYAEQFTKAAGVLAKGAGLIALGLSVVGLTVQTAEAETLYELGYVEESNRLWMEYLFGALGGAALGLATPFILAGGGLAGIPVAIGLNLLAGATGSTIGSILYDHNKEAVDEFFEAIRKATNFIDDSASQLEAFLNSIIMPVLDIGAAPTEQSDVLAFSGYREISGFGGDDILVGFRPEVLKRYEKIGPPPVGSEEDTRPEAPIDLFMVLDGGAGNDWVLTVLGDHAWTIGGIGRDWIFNTSKYGIIYGDTRDNLVPGLPSGVSGEVHEAYLSSEANSDNIWWWQWTTLMDARPNDQLRFFGYPLVGGNNSLSFTGLSFFIPGVGLGLAASPLFFDYTLPFITYLKWGDDLIVTNLLNLQLAGGTDAEGNVQDGIDLRGSMLIKDFDFQSTFLGWNVGNPDLGGDLGMLFKRANFGLALLGLIPGPLAGIGRILALADELLALGSGLIDHIQKMTMAAMAMADMKVWAHRS